MELMMEVWLITSGMLCIVGERKKQDRSHLHVAQAAPRHGWIHTHTCITHIHVHMKVRGSYTTRWARSARQLSSTWMCNLFGKKTSAG